ncbi:MAG: hypothetical protein LV479_00540 [Methylacidiphilales bacterium]|nr:hypothetical protein [Candidatus Methylacidiphilales bacterium]
MPFPHKNLFKPTAFWCPVSMYTGFMKFLFWAYLLFLVWADATVTNPADPDLWHRLALGDVLWRTGHFPSGDYFSYLADYQRIADHEWGSALIFYGLYQAFGFSAFVVLKLVTLGITLVLVVNAGLQGRKPTMFLAAFYALVLLAMLPSFQSTVRCMVFTHIFFALWLLWYQMERRGRPVLTIFYVLTMVIWANLHGGFVTGLAWLLVVGMIEFALRGDWKIWALRLGLCTAATLINPFGYDLWISTGRALTVTRHGFNEWAPVSWWPEPLSYPGYKLLLFGTIVALVLLVRFRGWRRLDYRAFILLVLFLVISLTSVRHTSLFAAVAGALLPGLFAVEFAFDGSDNPVHRLGLMAVRSTLLLIPLYATLRLIPGAGLELEYPHVACPREAIEYLKREKISGRLLVPFNYGSYALWALRGQMRVSMDGRYDLVYRPKTYQRVEDFFLARGDWQSLLTNPAPNAILTPVNATISAKLQNEPKWIEIWHNGDDAIFVPQ